MVKQLQLKSANEGDVTVNPPRNNSFKIFVMQKIDFITCF